MDLNSRGQAAVFDSLFMLSVVTSLAVLLFVFSNSYGNSINDSLLREYSTDFVTDALKTILYSSTTRTSTNSLSIDLARNPGKQEVDYLLAVIKEDFSSSQELSNDSKIVLKNNVEKIMIPMQDQFDYMFFIAVEKNSVIDYSYFLLYKSEFLCSNHPCPDELPYSVPGTADIKADDPAHRFYLCNLDPSNRLTSAQLKEFIFRLGGINQSSVSILLYKPSTGVAETTNGVISLAVWNSTFIPENQLNVLKCNEFDEAVSLSSP